MRYYELLVEDKLYKDYSRSEISKLIRKMIQQTGEDAWYVNNGWCWNFATNLAKILGPQAKVVGSKTDYKDGTFPGHWWVEYKGYHFDAESPYGEKRPKDMQYHRRLRAIADSEDDDGDENEIVKKALGHDPVYYSKSTFRPKVEEDIGVMNGNDFYDKFYSKNPKANPKLFDNLKYVYPEYLKDEILIVSYSDKLKVQGVVGLEPNPYEKSEVWLKYVSVDPKFQNKGIAKQLLTHCFDYVNGKFKAIEISSYSEDGLHKLKPFIQKLKKHYPELIIIEKPDY